MNSFVNFYDSIQSQEKYFLILRIYMMFFSLLNVTFVSFMVYLMINEGKTIKANYRQVLFFNLVSPAVFSFYLGFIYTPYMIFPYHFLLTVNFLSCGPFLTAHLFNILCSIAILCSMGFIYSFWFNYITICFRISKKDLKRNNLAGLIISLLFTLFNFTLMTIGVDDYQYESWQSFFNIDRRVERFFNDYSIAVVKVNDKWSLKVLSVEAFIGIATVIIIIPTITLKSYTTLNKVHKLLSKQTLAQLKSALAISLWYLLQYGLLVGIPAACSMALLLIGYTPSASVPLTLIILTPTQFTCPVVCVLYLLVIKPLRNGFLKMFWNRSKVSQAGFRSAMSHNSRVSNPINLLGRRPPKNIYSTLQLY